MRFKAKYISPSEKEYFRTIDADTESEANQIAKKYARKGYTLATMIQDEGRE
jgi:hypothetical protein